MKNVKIGCLLLHTKKTNIKNKIKNSNTKFSLEEPCPKCDAPYGYRNIMGLSTDTYRFSVSCPHPKTKKNKIKTEIDSLYFNQTNQNPCSNF